MLAHQIVGDEIADALVKRGRAFEIGEQESQAGDLELLIDVERVGAVDVAKGLIGEKPLCGHERLALAKEIMKLFAGDPKSRQHAAVGAVFQRQPQRPGPHLHGSGRRFDIVEDQRQRLALARRLALDVDELRAVGHRIERDDEIVGQLHRQHRALARRQLDRIDGEVGEALVQRFRQIDARAPENLPVIFDLGQRIRIVAGDAPHPRADREGNLDHFVERRLVAGGAKSAGIFLVIDGLERRAGIEHAAATRAKHVPGQFEQAEPRGMKESGQRCALRRGRCRRQKSAC